MNEADVVIGWAIFALLCWMCWKAFNKIEDSDNIKHDNKDFLQILVMCFIFFILPLVVVLGFDL